MASLFAAAVALGALNFVAAAEPAAKAGTRFLAVSGGLRQSGRSRAFDVEFETRAFAVLAAEFENAT